MNNVMIGVMILVVGISLILVYRNQKKTEKIYEQIEKMLNSAMEDTFTADSFDESRMSALEAKFAHYLSSSAASARAVKKEKETIKTLISDISHQTKTPISNLKLYLELLGEEKLPESAGDYLESLQKQTDKLQFLIASLVKLSRLENGILSLTPRKQDIDTLFDAVADDYASIAHEKGLNFSVEPAHRDAVYDLKWTREALGNIVDNAIKYTKTGGIRLYAREYEMFVRIDVEDTGIGISEGDTARIFSRFYRSDGVSDEEGVGIGLYLSREIIQAEYGYIKVCSEYRNGSVFSVFLPKD